MKSKINIYDIIREITSACIIMIFLIQHFEIYRTQAYLFSCGGGGERGGSWVHVDYFKKIDLFFKYNTLLLNDFIAHINQRRAVQLLGRPNRSLLTL